MEELIRRIGEDDPTLKEVSIPGQKITTALYNDMLDAFEKNHTVTNIDISSNSLQDIGVCELFTRLLISGSRMIRVVNVRYVGPFSLF